LDIEIREVFMDIIDVNVENLKLTSENIFEEGENLLNTFNSIRNIVVQVKSYWKAKSYNDLAKYFNSEIENIKKIINFSKNKIPETLGLIMECYAQTDEQNEYKNNIQIDNVEYLEVDELDDSTEEISINTNEIGSYISELKKELSVAKNSVSNINNYVINIEWNGESSKDFKEKVKNNVGQIIDYMDRFNKNIENCLTPIYNMMETQKQSIDLI
jgi:uncharacterized protein YukE